VRYLNCSLPAEGDSDLAFLGTLLPRQLDAIGRNSGRFVFEQLSHSDCRTVHSRDRVREVVAEDLTCFDLVFAHNDHNERGKLDQLRERLTVPVNSRLIGLVPVRETEAWILADQTALLALGGGVDVTGLPTSPAGVERLADPKVVLKQALGRRAVDDVFEFIGLNISLDRLAQVPAYQQFLIDLTTALKELNFQ
jgi:Domain of unknown function (DUF4276)